MPQWMTSQALLQLQSGGSCTRRGLCLAQGSAGFSIPPLPQVTSPLGIVGSTKKLQMMEAMGKRRFFSQNNGHVWRCPKDGEAWRELARLSDKAGFFLKTNFRLSLAKQLLLTIRRQWNSNSLSWMETLMAGSWGGQGQSCPHVHTQDVHGDNQEPLRQIPCYWREAQSKGRLKDFRQRGWKPSHSEGDKIEQQGWSDGL